ncbi:MAG: ABC transporter permease [Eubacteriales bacterium]|nr:ABC transporter permease [Eubacteriales bacterium]
MLKRIDIFMCTWRAFGVRFKIGLLIVSMFFIFGFIVTVFCPIDTAELSNYMKNMKSSSEHLLGTNAVGQDIFWQLLMSIKNSLIIGVLTATFATLLALLVGISSGFIGGKTERVVMFLCDTIIVIPMLPILIMIASLLKGRASIYIISLILIFFNWPGPARQTRSLTLSIREREFINTALFSGESKLKIIVCEIMPHIIPWAMANIINTILVAIAAESSMAVLGLSSASLNTLGTMIYQARQYQALLLGNWNWIGAPVVAMMVMFIGLFFTFTGYNEYISRKRGL